MSGYSPEAASALPRERSGESGGTTGGEAESDAQAAVDCREPGSYILDAMSRRNGDRCKFHIARRRKLAKRVRMRAALAKLLLNRAA